MSHPINSDEIQAAIDGQNAEIDMQHLNDILEAIQEDVEDSWNQHMAAVENGNLDIVAEEGEYLVLADLNGDFWQNQFDAVIEYTNLLGAPDEGTPEAIMAAHHNAAYRLTDYNWATSNPVVIRKPDSFESGGSFVEAGIHSLINEGLSPGQAWAYYGVVLRGNSRNKWAKRSGYNDHSTVSDAVRKAKEKLGE